VARRCCGFKVHEDSAGRSSLICAPTASGGRDAERACHLLLDALHRAAADAGLAGNLQNVFADDVLGLRNGPIDGQAIGLAAMLAALD
jgi:hypothetical protein